MRGVTTPTPETLRILCSKFPLDLRVEGITISPTDFQPQRSRPKRPEQLSLSLTEALLSIPQEQLKVKVLKRGSQSIDLKVTIDFRRIAMKPKRVNGRT